MGELYPLSLDNRKPKQLTLYQAGTGFAGVSVPFVMSWMLEEYRLRTTLRAWSVCLAVISTSLLFVVRPRIPDSQRHRPRKITIPYLNNRTFLFVQLGNILQGLGFFMSTIYLPTYARYLGVSNGVITATVSLLNGATVFGCIFVGVLIDRLHVTTATLICTAGATFSAVRVRPAAMHLLHRVRVLRGRVHLDLCGHRQDCGQRVSRVGSWHGHWAVGCWEGDWECYLWTVERGVARDEAVEGSGQVRIWNGLWAAHCVHWGQCIFGWY